MLGIDKEIQMDIEVKNLKKTYGEKTIFDQFSCRIPKGSCMIIMGPSGCGKTTFLRLLLGLEQPDAGTIQGVPSRRSVVFQENRLCEGLSAVENVKLVLDAHGKEAEIVKQLNFVGIEGESLKQPVHTFSGGMKRRVAVVRAMAAEADFLVLDEPCNGLDESTRQTVIQYIKEKRQGRTMLVVTHDREEAAQFEGQILEWDEGR